MRMMRIMRIIVLCACFLCVFFMSCAYKKTKVDAHIFLCFSSCACFFVFFWYAHSTYAYQKNTKNMRILEKHTKNMRIRMRIMRITRITRKILCVFLNAHIFAVFFNAQNFVFFS